jgi:bacitracin synthase 2
MRTFPGSICEAFDQTAAANGTRPALAGDAEALTYTELAARADRIGSWLLARGVGRGKTVGLFAQRSPDAIAAILGILKAGAAYLPLDPGYPKNLLQYIYEDSKPTLLLVQDALVASRPQDVFWSGETLSLGADRDLPETDPEAFSWPEIGPDDVAYIMYTSGSTGLSCDWSLTTISLPSAPTRSSCSWRPCHSTRRHLRSGARCCTAASWQLSPIPTRRSMT